MNAIVKQPAPGSSLIDAIQSMKSQIAAALPKHISVDRIVRIAMTVVRTNKDLANCNKDSFLGALIIASQLGLEPNTPLGQCYLLPYAGQCSFQIGYKGIIELAYRSKQIKRIFAEQIYPGDKWAATYGLNPDLKHERVFPEAGEPIAYYAVYELIDGGTHFVIWGRDRIIDHAKKYSKSYNNTKGPWKTSFDSMAKKTVLIDLLKYAPKSIEVAEALGRDSGVTKMSEDSSGMITLDTSFDEAVQGTPQDETQAMIENEPGADLLI